VEITGPVDRKMVINALNSGAKTYMADFEDSHCPTWSNTIDGQINLRDAVNRTIEFANPAGKLTASTTRPPPSSSAPAGGTWWKNTCWWTEGRFRAAFSTSAFISFHNAKNLLDRGSGPYFYLPKMESHLEARLWNDVFIAAQEAWASRQARSRQRC
jgi:malate synthase